MKDPLLSHILKQINSAKSELSDYPPPEIDWSLRAQKTASLLVPWVHAHGSKLKTYVEHVMNSPHETREAANQILSIISEMEPNETLIRLVHDLQASLNYELFLIAQAGGTVVSKIIENFLIECSTDWTLESNGASDYPDLFLRNLDYSGLPVFTRSKNMVYGAAIKGKQQRPVRVPDGLEIKTCKDRFAVDCHHAHAGLHLVMLFSKNQEQFKVNDIQIAFLRHELYRITEPASPTTTLKASFNGEHFVSILKS